MSVNLVPLLLTGVRLHPPGRTDKNLCRCFGAPGCRIFPDHLITLASRVPSLLIPPLAKLLPLARSGCRASHACLTLALLCRVCKFVQWAAADAAGCERCLTRWMRLRTASQKSKRSLPHLDVRHDWSFSNHQRLICLSVPQWPRRCRCPQSTHQTTPPPSPPPRPRVEPDLAYSCAAAASHSACWSWCCWHYWPLQQLLMSEQLELGPIR